MERLLFFSCPVVSYSLWPHGLQHTRPPCPSLSPEVCPSSCPLHQWCHPAIPSSDTLFSFCPQSFPASGLFQWVGFLHQVTKILEFQLQHQSFQWVFRVHFPSDWLVWSYCPRDSHETAKLEIWISEFNGDNIGGGLDMTIWILHL